VRAPCFVHAARPRFSLNELLFSAHPPPPPRSYNDAVTYGELFLQNEYEMSCYNLDEADVAEQVGGYSEQGTAWLLEVGLPKPLCVALEAAPHPPCPPRHLPPPPAPQRQRFALFDAEARRLLAKRLPVPAYDHLLKCSHTFNILDARGAVGVTERADCFATMRALAREVTGAAGGEGAGTESGPGWGWAQRKQERQQPNECSRGCFRRQRGR
jgi:hypothetical protein